MTSRDEARLDCLGDLVRRCHDGTDGHRKAARALADQAEIRRLLLRNADRRMRFAQQLSSYVTAAGGTPPATGSIAGGVQNCLVTVACEAHDGDPRAVLAAVAKADAALIARFEAALDTLLPSDLARATVAAQLAEIRIAQGSLASRTPIVGER